jgi:hypothetical protein
LNDEKDVLLIGASAEALVGLHDLKDWYSVVLRASDNMRSGEKWDSANRYIDYLEKTQVEIIATMASEYTLTELNSEIYIKYTDSNIEFRFQEGLCKVISIPFKSFFPDLSGEADSFKSLNIPFDCLVSTISRYRIYFENFAIFMDANENATVPADGMVEIYAS